MTVIGIVWRIAFSRASLTLISLVYVQALSKMRVCRHVDANLLSFFQLVFRTDANIVQSVLVLNH